MNLLEYSYTLLESLKNKEIKFSSLINKKISSAEVDSCYVEPLKDTMKAVVNRYYFLAWEIKHYLKGVALEEKVLDYLVLSLAFSRYARNVEFTKIESELIDVINKNSFSLDSKEVCHMLASLKETITSLPEVFNENFSKKISLNYSYPEWLVTMIRKHFGTRNAFKSIASSRKPSPISICMNELLIQEIDNENFKKTDTTQNSYVYVGTKKLFEEALYDEHKVFVLDQSEQKVLDGLKIYQGEKILIIGDVEPSFVVDSCIKISDLGKVRVALSNYENLTNMRKVLSKYKFQSFEAFESPINLVCTHTDGGNDRVIVLPKNSEFGLIRKKPEVLLSFRKEEFDVLLQEQYQYLKEASTFVKNDGEIDYIVPTLNKKETYLMIRKFLNDHPKFGLIEEQMIFPYEYKGEGIYYARLRKLGN